MDMVGNPELGRWVNPAPALEETDTGADHCNKQQPFYKQDVNRVQCGAQKDLETEGNQSNPTMKQNKKQLGHGSSFSPKCPLWAEKVLGNQKTCRKKRTSLLQCQSLWSNLEWITSGSFGVPFSGDLLTDSEGLCSQRAAKFVKATGCAPDCHFVLCCADTVLSTWSSH